MRVELAPGPPLVDRRVVDHTAKAVDPLAGFGAAYVLIDMLGTRSFVDGGSPVDALRLQRPPVNADLMAGRLEGCVGRLLPPFAYPLDRFGSGQARLDPVPGAVGQPQHAPSGFNVAVMDRDVDVGVVSVLARMMNAGKPSDPSPRQLLHETGHQFARAGCP